MKRILYNIGFLVIFLCGCDREVSVTSPPPKPSEGKITISSKPDGATIFINGRNTGKVTPATITWLKADNYAITLRKKYFYTIEDYISLTDNENREIFYNYFDSDKVYGKMKITSYPSDSAKIIIDGKETAFSTPHEFENVVPGKYLIKGFKESHWSDSIYHEVYSNSLTTSKLTVIDTTFWVQYNKFTSNIKSERVYQVCIDNSNRKWINLLDKGLSLYFNGKFIDISSEVRELNGIVINKIFLDDDDNLWVATGKGVFKKDNVKWSNFNTNNSGLPSNNIQDIKVRNGKLIVSTDNGCAVHDGSVWKVYQKSNTILPTDLVVSADIDANGNLFLGTSGFGIFIYDGNSWFHYKEENKNLLTNYISDIKIIKDQLFVICANEPPIYKQPVTNFGGLNVFKGNNFAEITFPLTAKAIYEVKEIDDQIWIATGNGAFQIDRNYNIVKTIHDSVIEDQVTNSIICIDKDSFGHYWFGCFDKGLIKYKERLY